MAFVVFQRESEQVAALRASPLEVGDRTVWVLPQNAGDNAFCFAYRHVVSLSLEKMPLELWNRRGVAASFAGFASLFRLEHACLHGSEFSSIFVLVKVEALHHIPHHIIFHRVDGNGIYADVIINEIWDVARSLGATTVTPRPPGRLDGDDADPRPPAPLSPWRGRAHPGSSLARGHVGGGEGMADSAFRAFLHSETASPTDFLAMLKLAAKPKLIRGTAFSLPTEAQILHEDELRLCLHSSLWATEVRTPRVSVTFDMEGLCFTFKLELNNSRVASCPNYCVLFPAPPLGAGSVAVAAPVAFDLNVAVEIQSLELVDQGAQGEVRVPGLDQQAEEEALPLVRTASLRRSPRISHAYDGVRMGSVERAAKRKAVVGVPSRRRTTVGDWAPGGG
uniref:DUF4283 domain-containing protein n=1 Tax=Aegilops tauschii TaxID=37682 RepID=N1QWJ2_AEGTA